MSGKQYVYQTMLHLSPVLTLKFSNKLKSQESKNEQTSVHELAVTNQVIDGSHWQKFLIPPNMRERERHTGAHTHTQREREGEGEGEGERANTN